MNFHDNYYQTGQAIPDRAARCEFYTAILEYYYEGVEPVFESAFAKIAFAGVRWSLGKARGGRLGGLANRQATVQAGTQADVQAGTEATVQAEAQASCQATAEANRQATTQAPDEATEQANAKQVPSKQASKGELVKSLELKGLEKTSKKEIPFSEIVHYLNEKTGKSFKASSDATRQLIRARFDEGYVLDDFKRVIDNKCATWLGEPEWEQYLKPSTLFRKTKFDGYLNERAGKAGGGLERYVD